ncbi:MAG TPA: AraC family transcriptional regulator [Firmicutes bacterium]|nr:AraC family transcriptional regulator [Bacillota bacterium]
MAYIGAISSDKKLQMHLWWATKWTMPPGWKRSRPLRRPYTNVWYVLSGQMGVDLGDQQVDLSQGTLAIIPPDAPSSSWNSGNETLVYLSLGSEIYVDGIDTMAGRSAMIFRQPLPERVVELWQMLSKLTDQAKENLDSYLDLRMSGIHRLIWAELIKETGLNLLQKPGIVDVRAHEAVTWMRQNLDKNISLDDVASVVHVSPSHLRFLFMKSFGLSFRDLLISMRIRRARALLIGTQHTISEIATQVGYNNARHFSRAFKRAEGLSPSAYRDAGIQVTR